VASTSRMTSAGAVGRVRRNIEQVVIEDVQTLDLGVPHLQQDVAFLERYLGIASGVGVGKACQGGPGGQRLLGIGADVGEDLEQGIGAEVIGVVMVGIAGEQGIDFLGEDRLDGVVNVVGGTRVGEPLGEAGDNAQRAFEGSDSEQPCVGDDGAALEIEQELLRTEVPQVKVVERSRDHDLEPP
jgi:hypothetical protein